MTASNLRILRRLVALAIPVGVFLSLAACVIDDGPTGLLIRQAQDMKSASSSGCSVPATATAAQKTEGVLDVTIPAVGENGYLLYPLVENQLGPFAGLAGTVSPVEEKNNITLKAFHVSLTVENRDDFVWPDGCSSSFDYPVVTQVLAPGGSASAIVKLIKPCNAMAIFQALDAEWQVAATTTPFIVNAKVRAKGHLGSGTIESPPFEFAVTVCYGCLQNSYDQPEAVAFRFPNVAKCSDLMVNPYMGEPCNPAQDVPILCCADSFDADGQTQNIQCPGIPTGKGPQ